MARKSCGRNRQTTQKTRRTYVPSGGIWGWSLTLKLLPQWTDRRKWLHLIIITLAAIVPDFDSGIGEPVNCDVEVPDYLLTARQVSHRSSRSRRNTTQRRPLLMT